MLAAASGRVLARSFHSVVHVGYEMIEKAAQNENNQNPEIGTDMTWTRMEVSMMLEHVQAHVAPTDVDPGAGVQWLPKIKRSSSKAKRTGALLERVFMPCDMYFQYTRHKGVTPDLKVNKISCTQQSALPMKHIFRFPFVTLFECETYVTIICYR